MQQGGKPSRPARPPQPTAATSSVSSPNTLSASARFCVALVCCVIVIVIVILLASLSRALERRDTWARYPPALVDRFSSLVRFAAQNSTIAAQDQNPVVALLHANSALAHAHVARTLLPARDAERIARIDLDELVLVLEEQQLDAMHRINRVCPSLQPDGVAAVASGWLG